MGTYIYTMRKRKQVFTLSNGDRAEANLFDYAYKPSYSFFASRRRELQEKRLNAAAERAFETYDDGFVIVGGLEDGVEGLQGSVVYDQVRSATWADCNEFPGRALGYIEVRNKRCFLVGSLPWYTHTTPNDREYRSIIKDGKAATEGRFISDHVPIIVGETVNDNGERIV